MADIDKAISEACANNNELGGFKLCELKRYLANRKQNISGRKAEVIERVKGAYKLSLKDIFELDTLDEQEHRTTGRSLFGPLCFRPSQLSVDPGWSTFYKSCISYRNVLKLIL